MFEEAAKSLEKDAEKKEEIIDKEKNICGRTSPFKLSVCLSEKENKYLDLLSKKAKLSGGNKLPKNMVIRSFVKAFMSVELDITGFKIRDDKVLLDRVRGFIKK